MRNFFRYMAGSAARWVRGIIGFVLIGWGYTNPLNLWIIGIGTILLLGAIFNISILAPLFGYSILGNKIVSKHGEINGVPGEDLTGKNPVSKKSITDNGADHDKEERNYAHHATTKGGSNYGQGSSQLGGEAYRQGSTKTDGSNYNNEHLSNEANANKH